MSRTRIIVVRHGQTTFNLEGRRQGQSDSPLTSTGLAQAEALAERLAHEQFRALYSSDLGRAYQTAHRIAVTTSHKIVMDSRLRERHFGIFEGLTAAEIKQKYPDEYRLYQRGGPDYAIPGGESARQRFQRSMACLEELAGRHRKKSIVVVTHHGVLDGLLRHVLSIPLEVPRRFKLFHGGFNQFAYKRGTWILETWGDISHLSGLEISGD